MRPLLAHEIPLVETLFGLAGLPLVLVDLVVTTMSDGGMGSLAIGENYKARRFGKRAAECHFIDNDGVPVSATLNIDSVGQPYEIDVWKVNFEPTLRWPTEPEIRKGPL